ncbi:MAG: hypothetical protein QM831_26120 [Kofleriaceae bacterium]
MRALLLLMLCGTAAADPIVLKRGEIDAALTIESNLAPSGGVTKPLSFAPDVWYGVTDELTLGIIHSDASLDHIEPGASLCVRTDDFICTEAYRGSGLDALYQVLHGEISLAARARFLIRDVDPWKPALTLGALARWQRGRYEITADPYLQLGLTNRSLGNRAELWLPVVLSIAPWCGWWLDLHTGWNSDWAIITEDGWHVPVGFGTRADVTKTVRLGAMFGFTSLLGPQNNPKQRVLFLSVEWHD